MHLLLWSRVDSGVVGVEVERVALLSNIVAKLPTTESEGSRIVLADSRGQPVHQWGLYEPPLGEAAVGSLTLAYPLDTWSLEYYAAPAQRAAFVSQGSRASVYLGVGAVAIALLTLGVFLFRGVRSRLCDAAERVNFVTRVSHELKTPLTNIRLYAELLEHEIGDKDTSKRLPVVVAESQRLTRLINNILSFSRKRRDRLTITPTSIEVDNVLAAVVEQFEPALRQRGIEPELDLGVDEPAVADADAIGQIVANLLSNVLKYGTEGKHVLVSSRIEDEWVCIAVADRGPGVSGRDARDIFKPFVRLSDSLSEGVSGTGIGLSIARDLARLHGGDLVLAGGSGSRFELRIPHEEEST